MTWAVLWKWEKNHTYRSRPRGVVQKKTANAVGHLTKRYASFRISRVALAQQK